MSAAVYRPHPGRAAGPRQVGVRAVTLRSFWVDLGDEQELFESCKTAAMVFPGESVLFRLSGLDLSRAALHVVEDGEGGKMVRYTEPIVLDRPSTLLGAHMTIGWDGGVPVPHAHGYLVTSEGRVLGGHLSPGRCFLARRGEPVEAQMEVLVGCAMTPEFDEETGFRLLTPVSRKVHHGVA